MGVGLKTYYSNYCPIFWEYYRYQGFADDSHHETNSRLPIHPPKHDNRWGRPTCESHTDAWTKKNTFWKPYLRRPKLVDSGGQSLAFDTMDTNPWQPTKNKKLLQLVAVYVVFW